MMKLIVLLLTTVVVSGGAGTCSSSCSCDDVDSDGKLTIESGYTSINSEFTGCKNLIEIIIPDTVTSIGSSAFKDASSLKTVAISQESSALESIGYNAFYGCSSLEAFTIPNQIT